MGDVAFPEDVDGAVVDSIVKDAVTDAVKDAIAEGEVDEARKVTVNLPGLEFVRGLELVATSDIYWTPPTGTEFAIYSKFGKGWVLPNRTTDIGYYKAVGLGKDNNNVSDLRKKGGIYKLRIMVEGDEANRAYSAQLDNGQYISDTGLLVKWVYTAKEERELRIERKHADHRCQFHFCRTGHAWVDDKMQVRCDGDYDNDNDQFWFFRVTGH
eukprot:Platyproteum_vivax@DN7452_c0_g1_i2.p1